MKPLFFEDLHVGDCWQSETRQISPDDVVDFAELTGDHDPLHSERSDSPFGRPVAHGLLGLSVLAGLSSQDPQVQTLALVGIDGWEFHHPIYPGDSVTAITEVASVEPYGRRAGRVCWHRRLVNQSGLTVQSGQLTTLVAARQRSPRRAPVSEMPATLRSRAAAR
jgi:acyl dehydratase